MSDIVDDAEGAREAFLREALSRVPAPKAAHGIGLCLWCGEEVDGERRWCNAEHRDAWEAEQKRRNGA